jgi:hypothetical protein
MKILRWFRGTKFIFYLNARKVAALGIQLWLQRRYRARKFCMTYVPGAPIAPLAMPRAFSASAMALFFPRLRRRFTALRLRFRGSRISSRPVNNYNRTAAHGPVEVSRLLPGVWRLVIPLAVLCLLPNHLQDPFCRQQPACFPAIGKLLDFSLFLKIGPSVSLVPIDRG